MLTSSFCGPGCSVPVIVNIPGTPAASTGGVIVFQGDPNALGIKPTFPTLGIDNSTPGQFALWAWDNSGSNIWTEISGP